MGERRRGRGIGALSLTVLLTACGLSSAPEGNPGTLQISFEERAEPGVFEREGPAVRDAPDGAAGLWAAVPGLPRPERARIINLETRAEVTVALFAAGNGPIRLSNEAADALGIGDRPVAVRVTALRRLPQIEYNRR
jgi:hypothetical protein